MIFIVVNRYGAVKLRNVLTHISPHLYGRQWQRELKMNIKEVRIKCGLTQGQLADKIGVEQQHVSRWELGEHRPSVDVLIKIAAVLNCNIGDLI